MVFETGTSGGSEVLDMEAIGYKSPASRGAIVTLFVDGDVLLLGYDCDAWSSLSLFQPHAFVTVLPFDQAL